MSWTELDMRPKTLEVDTMYKVYDNIDDIHSRIVSKGSSLSSLTPSTVAYNTQIYQVRDELQTIENDIDVLESATRIGSIYYNEHNEVGSSFKLNDYQRWVKVLNDFDMQLNTERYYRALRMEEKAIYMEGKQILLRGDYD